MRYWIEGNSFWVLVLEACAVGNDSGNGNEMEVWPITNIVFISTQNCSWYLIQCYQCNEEYSNCYTNFHIYAVLKLILLKTLTWMSLWSSPVRVWVCRNYTQLGAMHEKSLVVTDQMKCRRLRAVPDRAELSTEKGSKVQRKEFFNRASPSWC